MDALVLSPMHFLAVGGNWRDQFVPFTAIHVATVAVCAAAMLAACGIGRWCRDPARERRFRVVWGWAVLAYQSWYITWYAMPHRWDWKESLPLQLCDLAAFVAAFAMLTQWRPWRTILYFWGIGLSTQAFFTPTMAMGPMHTKFWLFWLGHTAIVGSAVYDVVVKGYRPRLRDLGFVLLTTYLLTMSVFFFNVLLSKLVQEPINYWYIGESKPDNPTVIDRLGPWPLSVLWLMCIVITDFVMLWAIWPVGARVLGRPATAAPCKD